MQEKRQQLEPDLKQWTGSKLGKEYMMAVYCHPAYITYTQSTYTQRCWAGWVTSSNQDFWEKYQQPQIYRWHQPYGRRRRGIKEPLDVGEKRSEKPCLKLNIQKTKIMAPSPITSWQIDGETMETVTDFIFLGSKITADSDCSHEIERCLVLERKAMTSLDSILKGRHMTCQQNICIVKAMVFLVVMYGYESWTMKKAEHWIIDSFEFWFWRRLIPRDEIRSPLPPQNHQPFPNKSHWLLSGHMLSWQLIIAAKRTLIMLNLGHVLLTKVRGLILFEPHGLRA